MAPERFVAVPGRLDAVVANELGRSRADVQRAIAAGAVTVDGRARPKSHRLEGGERIVAEIRDDALPGPEGPPVPVRFEDDDVLVVAKPAGVITHPTERRRTGTLVNRLLGMGVPLAPSGGPLRPGIVHRLDAGTSGLLVVAKTDEAYARLREVFRRHEAERRYVALVRGHLDHERFVVEAPLGRRAARIVIDRSEGRPASTSFDTRERLPRTSLLDAVPMTGRTHQIRVHLSGIGHPIVGDRAYGGGGDEASRLGLTRPFLHAARLAFRHPSSGETIDVEEPLPDDLLQALELARRDQRS
jgi:23S rRNA pseudouridine1911/1915/1917 synthase